MLKTLVLGLTLASCGAAAELVVAADGTGQFKSVQAAVDRAAPHSVIHIKPGIYKERVVVPPEKTFLTLRGDDPLTTVITFDTHAGSPGPDGRPLITFGTPTVFIQANDFVAENITFENSAGRQGQALALTIMSDRGVFRNCRFLGYQDTLLAQAGRQYFDRCYIEGAVDFIFGGSAAYFDHCEIHVKANGYITAANTPKDQRYGYVFSHTKITGEPGALAYLGRPWRPYAATVFLDTEMSSVIRPVGWNNWNDPAKEKTARYGEYPQSDASRVPWAQALTAAEAKTYTIENVLGGIDGWDPRTGSVKRAVRVIKGAAKPAPLAKDRALIATMADGLAYSTDGLKWTALTSQPAHGSLSQDPDGTFRLLWAADKTLNFATSKDLLRWSDPKRIDIMAKEKALDLASPHAFYDEAQRNFIVTWSSTIAANAIQSFQEEVEINPRIWYATTKDFESFSDAQLLFDPNYSVKDAVLLKVGARFALLHNDDTRPMQNLRVAFSNTPLGPWEPSSDAFTEKFTDSPSVVKFGDEWWIYHSRGLVTTRDFLTFTNVPVPPGTQITSVLEIPRSFLK
jgi:pectinesterase